VDEEQTINSMKALWKSGRDKFRSFLTQFGEVDRELGPAAMDDWCIHKLGIGLDAITKVTGIFEHLDERNAKAILAPAVRAEKEKQLREKRAAEIENLEHRNRVAQLQKDNALLIQDTEDIKTKKKKPTKKVAKPKKEAAQHDSTDNLPRSTGDGQNNQVT
jgi:hypothetical protein